MGMLDDLRAEAEAAEAEAKAVALTEEEQDAAALVARAAVAREEKAAALKAKRGLDLATRERAARSKVGQRVLVQGIDLVDFFPLGTAPDPAILPGKGVIIVRSPPAEALKTFHREGEAKERTLAEIYGDVLCASVIDPDVEKDLEAGTRLRAFLDSSPGVAIAAGERVVRLGGAKIKADKRGRV